MQDVYFHGVPGGVHELDLFGPCRGSSVAQFYIPARGSALNSSSRDEYFSDMADSIRRQFPTQSLRLIGFSLGASMALRTAYYMGDQIGQIELISAAAPLDIGVYLPSMAGAPVFRLAAYSSHLFQVMAAAQSLMAKAAPERMVSMLLSSAVDGDRALLTNPHFKKTMVQIIRHCFREELAAYRQEIELYVGEWQEGLDQITQPVVLHHGRSDNWSPVTMSEDLAKRLPNVESLNILDGMSHYSALREYLKNR